MEGSYSVEPLIELVSKVAGIGEYWKIHTKECSNLSRRIKLLGPLFEEVSESKVPLSNRAVECFKALEQALQEAYEVLRLYHDKSKLFLVVEMESVVKRFQEVTAEVGQPLDDLPYDELGVSDEVIEEVDLVRRQLRRAKGIDVRDAQLSGDVQSVLSLEGNGDLDKPLLERLAEQLNLQNEANIKQEMQSLERLQKDKESDYNVNSMTSILTRLAELAGVNLSRSLSGALGGVGSLSMNERSGLVDIPPDFRCPISLDLMRDPVIIASGETFERVFVQKWLDGHHTCPMTGAHLAHTNLTPNYALRRLILQWCESNGIEDPRRSNSEEAAVEELLLKLVSKKEDEQRAATGELRLLAKRSDENRICIAKAGAIPLLVKLLRVQDLKTQEHAVTTLLNLSINPVNKGEIVKAGAINPIVSVLRSGSMEARENAAATLFSLSVADENKVAIGEKPGAIPALVDLLKDGTARGKKDAATALFNLSIYQHNKARAVTAGVVPPLMNLLNNKTSGMVDEALAILAILASHPDGKAAIAQASPVPTLVNLITVSSPRNKENAAAVLLALCTFPANINEAIELGAETPLTELSQSGTPRAKKKSLLLLEHMKNRASSSALLMEQMKNAMASSSALLMEQGTNVASSSAFLMEQGTNVASSD